MLLREANMSRLSKCLDAPVVVKGNGKLVGYIKNVYFDKIAKIFAYFSILSDEGQNFLLPTAGANLRDALMLDDENGLLCPDDVSLDGLTRDILGVPAFTQSGAYKGNVLDAQFSQAGKLTKLTLSSGEVSPSAILCFGDVVLLKAAKPSSAPKIPRPQKDYAVELLDGATKDIPQRTETLPDSAGGTLFIPTGGAISFGGGEPLLSQGALNAVLDGSEAPAVINDEAHTPTRIICDYEFLLGRTLGADLKTYAGELLASKGAAITSEIVEVARAHGKLVELTLSSVKRKR